MSLSGVLASLLLIGGPPTAADLPQLIERGSVAVQAGWESVKEAPDRAEQLRRIRSGRLLRLRCNDTLPFEVLMRRAGEGAQLRDTVRWRTAARPEMAALILEAMRLLREKVPNARVSVGDIAQPGCGQIRYGTLIRFVPESEAKALTDAARVEYGALTIRELLPPEHFTDEWPRFHEDLGPVHVERILTGRTRDGQLRLELRRFDPGQRLGADSVTRLLERTGERVAARARVTWDRVWHTPEQGEAVRLRRATWHNPRTNRWMEAVFRPGNVRPVTARNLLRVREARTDPRKPTSLKFEERYRFEWDGEAGVRVRRHTLHYEAHHSSHIGGLDADLSYVTHNNANHFVPDMALLDPLATWHWMKALDTAARNLSIPLKALFVDRSIIQLLKSVPEASRRDRVWRKLRRSPGHDSHVHVRIGTSARVGGYDVDEVLKLLSR